MDHVGVLGLGRMGFPIARRLLHGGVPVTVFDLEPDLMAAIQEEGADVAGDARELAAQIEVLLTVLPGPGELRETLLGSGGALKVMRPGSVWLDLTSSDPRTAAAAAEEAHNQGVACVGAPMIGNPVNAVAGTLGFYIGGTPDAVDRVLPLLAMIGDPGRFLALGADVTAGYTTKLLANTLWFGQAVAVTEVLLLGQELGLDLHTLRVALQTGPSGSTFITEHLGSLLEGDYLTTFGIDRVVEELDTVTSLAAAAGTPSDLMLLVAGLHHEALQKFGPVDGELLAAKLLEGRAGRTLRA